MINQKEDSGTVISIIMFRQQTAKDLVTPSISKIDYLSIMNPVTVVTTSAFSAHSGP